MSTLIHCGLIDLIVWFAWLFDLQVVWFVWLTELLIAWLSNWLNVSLPECLILSDGLMTGHQASGNKLSDYSGIPLLQLFSDIQ